MFDSINSDLGKIVAWGDRNLVKFNSKKTQVSYISHLKTGLDNHQVYMGDEGLKDVDSVRILGVDITSNLN